MSIFRLNNEERVVGGIALVVILAFQYLITAKFYVLFADYSADSWNVFMRNFHMSGFDPITYSVVSDWNIGYNIIRHPLLPFLLYPFFLLNRLLWAATGVNCVQFVVGSLLVFCTFYSVVFLYRILRHVGSSVMAVGWLTALFFSFAYILVAVIVPDHFCLSLFLILLTLHVAQQKMETGGLFSMSGMLCLLIPVAGVTLSNGVIVLLAVWLVNGFRQAVRPLLAGFVVLVLFLLLGFAVNVSFEAAGNQQVVDWIDTSLSRWDTLVENFFGESIQLHRKYILGDVLVKRPVFVAYSWKAQYAVESVVVVLFMAGAWCGRRSRFLWLVMACFCYSVALHLVLGFAIEEVYIMSAHWLYAVPVAMAYVLHVKYKPIAVLCLMVVAAIALYLWAYHGFLLYNYLTWPLTYK